MSTFKENRNAKRRWPGTRRVLIEALEKRALLTTIVVNTIVDQMDAMGSPTVSVRDAIAAANVSSTPTTITFDPTVFATAQTIVLGGTPLELSNTGQSTTITGPAAGVTISGNGQSTVFQIDSGVSATLQGLTVTNGLNTNTDFSSGGGGAGIDNFGNVTLYQVNITDNSSDGWGGGLWNSGFADISDSSITGNTAAEGGGGVHNQGGFMALRGVTLSGNTNNHATTGAGAAIDNSVTSTLFLTNVTIADNTSTNGFAFYNDTQATATLTNVTITANSGGGIDNTNSLTIANSIVANNTVSGGSGGPDVSGSVTSSGNNLIGEADGSSGWIASDLTGTIARPLNADLGALGDNGGTTQTVLPLTGSPAIGAGSVALIPAGVTTDQRDWPRVVNGAVDIGAVEVQPTPVVSTNMIANPSFETNSAWVPSVSGAEFSGSYESTWASQGSQGYEFVRPAGYTTAGDYVQISQTGVDLTGVSGLYFDCRDTGIDFETLQFLVDGTSVGQYYNDGWPVGATIDRSDSGNWGHTATTYNIVIPFNTVFTGTHTLTIQVLEGSNYDPLDPKTLTIDNLRTYFEQSTRTAATLNSTDTAVTTGTAVSFTAAFAAASGSGPTPTGTITFLDGSTQIGTAMLNTNGAATFTTTALSVGMHTITASYSGDANYAPEVSPPVVETVTAAASIGNLDPIFGVGGLVAHDVNLTSTAGLVVLGDGESVIAGTTGSAGDQAFGITRYNADGSLDTTFGTDGFTATPFAGNAQASSEVLLADGDVLVAGTVTTLVNGESSGSQFALAEYTSAGVLDTTFGNGAGYVLTSFSSTPDTLSDDVANALAVGPGGTIYVGGSSDANGGNPEFAVAAYTPLGNPSTGFGQNGQVFLDFLGGADSIGALALSARGELIVAGSAVNPSSGVSSIALAEFLPSGALDPKFGVKGKLTTSVGGVNDAASALGIDPKGNIVVGGFSATGSASAGTLSSNFALLRYTSAGTLDKTFGKGGIVATSFNQPAAITNVLIDPDGTIVASGKTAASLATLNVAELNLAAARYTVKGQLDRSFNGTGTAIYNLSNAVTTASLTSPSSLSSGKDQSAFLLSPFDTTSDLMTMFTQLTQSDQGTIAMINGGELADVGNNGINTVEAHIIAMGLELAATLIAPLPPSLIGGAKGTASVNITELGTESADGTFAIELFASTSPYPAAGQPPFQNFPENLRLKEGARTSVKLKFQYPSLSAGTYYLVATVDTGTVRDLAPDKLTSASASTVRIAPPFAQLAGSGLTTPAFVGDKPALVSVTLTNVGNETASAASAVEFFASTNGTPSGAIALVTPPLKVRLKPSAPQVFKVKLALPAMFPAGTYLLVALLDPANVFKDPNAATNFIVSGSMFVVM